METRKEKNKLSQVLKLDFLHKLTETLIQKNRFFKFQKANGKSSDDFNLQISSKSYLEKDHNQVAVELAASNVASFVSA